MVPNVSRRHALLGVGVALAGSGGVLTGKTGRTETATASDQSSDADWPMARYDAAGTGYNPAAVGPKSGVEVAWEREPEGFSGGSGPPILVGDTLYVTGGRFVALDTATGDVRFGHEGSYRSTPARADAQAYATDTLAVTGPTGVYGLNAGGGLQAFGLSLGVERWYGPGETPSFGVFGPPTAVPPVAVEGTVYAVIPGTARLVALNASSGRELWRRSPGDELRRPAVEDGIVFAVNWPYQATAYDAKSGERRWQRELDEQMVLAPTATSDAVVVPHRSGATALEASDGSVRWRFDHGGNATEGAAAVAEGRVYVQSGLNADTLHALDLETGAEQWSIPVTGEGTPVVADGVVYASGYHEITALDAETGAVRWRHEHQLPVSTVAVSDGAVYATAHNVVFKLEESA